MKNDDKDAAELADLLRTGRLPKAQLAPAEIRELPELTRYKRKLVQRRSGFNEQVHAVLAKVGAPGTCTGVLGGWGSGWLDDLRLPQPYAGKAASLRKLTAELGTQTALVDAVIAGLPGRHEATVATVPCRRCRHRAGAGRGDRGRDRRRPPVHPAPGGCAAGPG